METWIPFPSALDYVGCELGGAVLVPEPGAGEHKAWRRSRYMPSIQPQLPAPCPECWDRGKIQSAFGCRGVRI